MANPAGSGRAGLPVFREGRSGFQAHERSGEFRRERLPDYIGIDGPQVAHDGVEKLAVGCPHIGLSSRRQQASPRANHVREGMPASKVIWREERSGYGAKSYMVSQ